MPRFLAPRAAKSRLDHRVESSRVPRGTTEGEGFAQAGARRPLLAASLALGVLLVAVSLANQGCETTCGDGNEPTLDYADGLRVTSVGEQEWRSTEWGDVWLQLPAKRHYRLHHGLNTTDYEPMAWVSFDERPATADGEGDFSVASGNQVVFSKLEANTLELQNDTCSDLYVMVRLRAR